MAQAAAVSLHLTEAGVQHTTTRIGRPLFSSTAPQSSKHTQTDTTQEKESVTDAKGKVSFLFLLLFFLFFVFCCSVGEKGNCLHKLCISAHPSVQSVKIGEPKRPMRTAKHEQKDNTRYTLN